MTGENEETKPNTHAVRIPPNRLPKLNRVLTCLLAAATASLFLAIFGAGQPLLALLAFLALTASVTLGLYNFFDLLYSFVKSALRANEHGISDATGPLPGGLVRWDEISGIAESTIDEEPVLLLHLHDPQAYLDRLPEPKRSLLRASVPIYGTPCVVAQSDIGIPVAEAQRRLEEARQQFVTVAVVPPVSIPATGSTVATAPTAHWWTAVPPEERKAEPLRNGVGDSGDR